MWYTVNTYKYQEAKHNVDTKNYNYLNAVNSVELSVRKAYYNMKNAYESLEVLDANLNLYQKSFEMTQKRYDLGLATSIELSEGFQKLADIEIRIADAILEYLLSERQFEYSYNIGISGTK